MTAISDIVPPATDRLARARALHWVLAAALLLTAAISLQIGATGVILMILLVALASVVSNRAARTDATAVPEAAPTTEPSAMAPQNDPLVEAGVVPDLPATPVATPAATPTSAASEPAGDVVPAE